MPSLGDFPPDVMREAEYWWRKDACSTPNANLYARAILAERERAAKIAEEVGIPMVANSDRILMVPADIAAAIRKGER